MWSLGDWGEGEEGGGVGVSYNQSVFIILSSFILTSPIIGCKEDILLKNINQRIFLNSSPNLLNEHQMTFWVLFRSFHLKVLKCDLSSLIHVRS